MRFGFHALNLGALATPEAVRQIVVACERDKIDSIWTGDHIINATAISSPYPYSPTGTFPLRPEEPILEPLTFMAFLAGQTSTIQIGVSVLIVPYRNPVVTARALGTLDFLSNGRVIVGVGSGWMKEEFDALGVPFTARGAQTDEFIRIFKEIWTQSLLELSFQERGSHSGCSPSARALAAAAPVLAPIPPWSIRARTFPLAPCRCPLSWG